MTALIIVGCILAGLLLLLLLPIRVKIFYKNEFKVVVRYLFFKYTVPMTREEGKIPPPAETEPKTEQSRTQQLMELFKRRGLHGFLDFASELAKLVLDTSRSIVRRIKLRECNAHMVVSGEDAADTAIQYGRACGIVYPAFSLIFSYIPCKKHNVSVNVDFQKTKTEILFSMKLRIMLLPIVIEALRTLVKLVPMLRQLSRGQGSGAKKQETAQTAPPNS